MAVRSVRVYLHNETGDPLVKVSEECPHGEWTRRGPARVERFSTAMMRAASILAGGVESRVTYQIGADPGRTLYMHWNNPIAGANTYHTNTAPGTYAFYAAPPSGSDPVAHFFIRPAGTFATDFLPLFDGFGFKNSWPDTPYSLPPLRDSLLDNKYGNAKDGLCGGMVLTALDYFVAGQEIPRQDRPPAGEQDLLFQHLVDRLFDTFSVDSVSLMLKLMNPLYPDGDENVLNTFGLANGRAAVMARQEWPLIRSDIDAGRPSPICVITVKSLNPGDLGLNHQVLAYAYDADGHQITLRVYDPNQPKKDDIRMSFSDGDVSNRIVVQHNVAVGGRPIYCFVRMNNKTKPIPISTQPRVTGAERRARRVHIERQVQTVVPGPQVASGRRKFPVFPDCGEHEFDYFINSQTVRWLFTVRTPHYRQPVVTWRLNNTRVREGAEQHLLVPADSERPDDAPPRAGASQPGMISLRTWLRDRELEFISDPNDGNYSLSVEVEVHEASEPGPTASRSTSADVVGLNLVVPRWEDANAGCWKDYLNRHRSAGPEMGAVADALFAQHGRPPDPLWDPDPTAPQLGALIAEADPQLVQIADWKQEMAAPAIVSDVGRASVDALRSASWVKQITFGGNVFEALKSNFRRWWR